jgi:Fe-S cluster assembly ATP-binding protein
VSKIDFPWEDSAGNCGSFGNKQKPGLKPGFLVCPVEDFRCSRLAAGLFLPIEISDKLAESASVRNHLHEGSNRNPHEYAGLGPLEGENMLKIEDLQVKLGDRVILEDINMVINPGETCVLFGPNGSGKTSLLMTIMGYPQYRLTGGKIWFRGQDITSLPINERAALGIGMSYQRPPTIHGLKTRQMVSICSRKETRQEVENLARALNFEAFLDRDLNAGFSGGEIKRSELLQLMAQAPQLLLFDEPESGVDLENIELIGKTIRQLLQQERMPDSLQNYKELRQSRTRMGLIISHTGFILDYVNADKGQVLYDGTIACEGNPREILETCSKFGYKECVRCLT